MLLNFDYVVLRVGFLRLAVHGRPMARQVFRLTCIGILRLGSRAYPWSKRQNQIFVFRRQVSCQLSLRQRHILRMWLPKSVYLGLGSRRMIQIILWKLEICLQFLPHLLPSRIPVHHEPFLDAGPRSAHRCN